MTKDFNRAKIYRIVSPSSGLVYIGATTKQYLSQRLTAHKRSFREWSNGSPRYMTSFKVLENNDARIELVENCPCTCIDELNVRERYWIENTDCVNKVVPGRTDREYRETRKDDLREMDREYREQNRDKIMVKNKEYYKENKDELSVKMKEYYKGNRDGILEKMKEKFVCECGGRFIHVHKARHICTMKHQHWLKEMLQMGIEPTTFGS